MQTENFKITRILIKGKPGIGKTTLIKAISEKFPKDIIKGFYTIEVREKGERIGFDIINFNGKKSILARKNLNSPYHVGKYAVDLVSFENIALPSLVPDKSTKLFIIDEIGKMECFSNKFKSKIKALFLQHYSVIATVPIYHLPIIDEILNSQKCQIIEINLSNRNSLLNYLLSLLK